MARIAGVDLPGRKHTVIALQYIYGIGPHHAKQICADAKIPESKRADDLDETDVKWDNTFSAAVAPFVDVTFDFNLVYDRDISTAVQIKEALAIGLIFKLGTKVE